jgi:aspartate carbamoyltransferase catalytic subunit
MGTDAVVIRHHASGAAQVLAQSNWIRGAIVNAGDGTHEHPTQALLDAFTLRQSLHGAASRGKSLDGARVAIVGDILHSRVASSNLILLKTLGAEVHLVAPATLLPSHPGLHGATVHYDLDELLNSVKLDAVMMLRIQLERMSASFFPTEREYSRLYGLNGDRLGAFGPTTILMHPGPMNRGLEIDAIAADSDRSVVLAQVRNGVSVRMAVLFNLLSHERTTNV